MAASSVGTLVAGLTGGIVIVTLTGLIAAPLAAISSIPADARLWTAHSVLLGVAHIAVNLHPTGYSLPTL